MPRRLRFKKRGLSTERIDILKSRWRRSLAGRIEAQDKAIQQAFAKATEFAKRREKQ